MSGIQPGKVDGSTINIDLTGPGRTPVIKEKSVVNLGAGSTDDHDYTALLTTFRATQVVAAASGMIKVEIFQSGTLLLSAFNSTNNPSIVIKFEEDVDLAVGTIFKVRITNREVAAQNVYSTIIGEQLAP
jgi:hypothetical protein